MTPRGTRLRAVYDIGGVFLYSTSLRKQFKGSYPAEIRAILWRGVPTDFVRLQRYVLPQVHDTCTNSDNMYCIP